MTNPTKIFTGIIVLIIICSLFVLNSCSSSESDNIIYEYYANGHRKSETPVLNDSIHGTKKEFSENGTLIKATDYSHGVMNGNLCMYNPENGKMTYKFTMVNGVQQGPCQQFYDTGDLFRESSYLEGRIDGKSTTYWANQKIKAVAYYKKGKPGIDLKEYDMKRNEISQPYIVVKEINQTALLNKVILDISLSDKSDAKFYLTELEDNKFLPLKPQEIYSKDGKAELEYFVSQGAVMMKVLNIVAKKQTKFGSVLILQKKYMLSASNTY